MSDALTRAPHLPSRPLRLIRCGDTLKVHVLCTRAIYLPSHWRKRRSYPCVRSLQLSCPWCVSHEVRHHAYLAVARRSQQDEWEQVILELPPQPLQEALDQLPHNTLEYLGLTGQRHTKHSQPDLHFITLSQESRCVLPLVPEQRIITTLCAVYGLPRPDAFADERTWLTAVQQRVQADGYTPARRQAASED
jgi:hypothetical protein